MKDHLELQRVIPAYVASRLSDDERRTIEVHLASCAECQDLVTCCEEVGVEVLREARATWVEHPDPMQLRAHAEGERPSPDVAHHLEICASCALESALPRPATRPAQARPLATPWFAPRPLLAGALLGAAACLALVLVLPRGGSAPTGPSPFVGSAPLLLLEEASRNGSSTASVRVASGQPYIPMGVRVSLPPAVSDLDRFRFSLRGPDRSVSWTQELSVAEIRAEQARSWVVGFLVPSQPHPPNRYVLVVAPAGDDAAPILEVPFEVTQ